MTACSVCQHPVTKKCSCLRASYCSKECQIKAWPEHRRAISHDKIATPRRVVMLGIDIGKFSEHRVRLLSYRPRRESVGFANDIESETRVLNYLKNRDPSLDVEQLLDLTPPDVVKMIEIAWLVFDKLVKNPRANQTPEWEDLMLKPSTIPGIGVGLFARRQIEGGRRFFYAMFDIKPNVLARTLNYNRSKGLPFYLVEDEKGNGANGLTKNQASYPAFANSDEKKKNAELYLFEDRVIIYTLRPIMQGEEIFVTYTDAIATYLENPHIPNYVQMMMEMYGDGEHANLPLFQNLPPQRE